MTVHRTLAVVLDGGAPVPLLRRGAGLPASETVVLRTGALARRGTPDPIAELDLVEDDGSGLDRAPVVGTLRMSARSARRDVPAGSAIQVGVRVDGHRRGRLEVYLPTLDEDESVAVTLADGPAAAPADARPAEPRPGPTPSVSESAYEKLFARRILVLGADIDAEMANRIMAQLLVLEAEDPTAAVSLYLNSSGGSVTDGMAVYDTMRFVRCDVATYAMGLAAGMAQVLLCAGTPGRRTVLRHGSVKMTPIVSPHPDSDEHRRIEDKIVGMVAEHTGQPAGRVRADMAAGRWFTPDEAVAYGLADRVQDATGPV